jgi:hypothetical protein
MYRCIKMATLLVVMLLLPAVATAQVAQASITGVVRDSSGAVLPGVTVEAASPVLIEKVRSVVTDGSGQYRIVDLLPGTYAVTFTLAGFSTVRREGVELIGSLTATVNIDLRVGALEETITVTGESPIVDVQSARRQQVIDGNVLQEIPTSRSYNNVLQIVPGIVAGDGQVQLRPTMLLFTAAGGNAQDGRLTVDGINTGASRGGSGVSGYVPDMQNVSEVLFTMSGNLGEAETGGPQMQIVPRSGGNRFTGSFFATGVNEAMQDSNFTPELLRVLTAPAKVLHLYDFQASVGGPIKKDNIWFFFNWREVGSGDAQPGIFANRNAGDPTKWTYDPDLSRQARIDQTRKIMALRLTWQATPRNKFTVFYDNQPNCTNSGWTDQDDACHSAIDGWVQGGSQVNGFFGPGPNAPETGDYSLNPQRVQQVKWQSPATSRLLLEAGFGIYASRWGYEERPGNPTRNLVRVQEQFGSLPNLKYRSSNWPNGRIGAHTWNASASYVTGAHNMKFGYQGAFHRDIDNLFTIISNDQRLSYRFGNTIPNQLTMDAGPWRRQVRTEYMAFYAQEQWTRDRLTLQGALRYDRAWSYFPEQTVGPDRFIPNAITFPTTKGIDTYNDISPRVGAAYDLFGNGRTSVKFNIGRYLAPATNDGRYVLLNPAQLMVTQTNRAWTDGNGNYSPDCDLMNPADQNNLTSGGDRCGPWTDQNFGKARPATAYDPELVTGWGVRPADWQLGAAVQHELMPRISLEVSYIRRWWHGFQNRDVTDNLLRTAADYDKFSVVAPADPRLPDGGGYVVEGIYDQNTSRIPFGVSENIIQAAEAIGNFDRYFDGFGVTVSARLRNGLTLQGGTSTGRLVEDICDVRDQVPETNLINLATPTYPWCRQTEPMLTQVKALGSYTIPKIDVLVAGTFSSRPGVALQANRVYTSQEVAQWLGRPLAGGTANITVNVLEPNTMFGDRIDQLDFRIAKILRFGRTRTNVALDLVNALNSHDVLSYNPLLNATWPTPTAVLTARLMRISAQIDF